MRSLIRMRLVTFVRTGLALAPLLAGLVVLGVLHGGGEAQAAEAYGVSAVVMFPVLAWQTKALLDAEPDVQRRIARVAIGSAGREAAAGLLAGAVAGVLAVLVALVLPWLVGGITGPVKPGDQPLISQIGVGAWAHLLAVPPAVLLGALASRAVTGGVARGLTVLVTGVIGTLVLGLKGSLVPWLVPPVMLTARLAARWSAGAGTEGPPPWTAPLWASWLAVAWTLVALTGYLWLRRTRA